MLEECAQNQSPGHMVREVQSNSKGGILVNNHQPALRNKKTKQNKTKVLIGSTLGFLLCKYSYHGQFQITSTSLGCTIPHYLLISSH